MNALVDAAEHALQLWSRGACATLRMRPEEARALLQEIEQLRLEVRDLWTSFDLYHKASTALMHAYKTEHPEVPDTCWPDTSTVNAWAAEQIVRGVK